MADDDLDREVLRLRFREALLAREKTIALLEYQLARVTQERDTVEDKVESLTTAVLDAHDLGGHLGPGDACTLRPCFVLRTPLFGGVGPSEPTSAYLGIDCTGCP